MTPLYGTDLDDVLDTLAELEDEGIDLIIAGFRNITDRARNGQLDLDLTKVLLAALAASPDGADVVGACGFAVADLTEHNPALHDLADDARKDATRHGQEAAFRLTDDYPRRPPSEACAALDRIRPTDKRQAIHDKVRQANHQSRNRPK
jgi:hypothetical protein